MRLLQEAKSDRVVEAQGSRLVLSLGITSTSGLGPCQSHAPEQDLRSQPAFAHVLQPQVPTLPLNRAGDDGEAQAEADGVAGAGGFEADEGLEHVVHALIAVVDRLVVLHGGVLIAEGDPAEVIRRPQVSEIYMGIEEGIETDA